MVGGHVIFIENDQMDVVCVFPLFCIFWEKKINVKAF